MFGGFLTVDFINKYFSAHTSFHWCCKMYIENLSCLASVTVKTWSLIYPCRNGLEKTYKFNICNIFIYEYDLLLKLATFCFFLQCSYMKYIRLDVYSRFTLIDDYSCASSSAWLVVISTLRPLVKPENGFCRKPIFLEPAEFPRETEVTLSWIAVTLQMQFYKTYGLSSWAMFWSVLKNHPSLWTGRNTERERFCSLAGEMYL